MTYSPPWKQMPTALPIDATTYWICQYRWFSTPFLATYDDATETWQPEDLTLPIPWTAAPWFRAQ